MATGTAFPPPFTSGTRMITNHGGKIVPMKLFATWEIDRTPPNCIPRLCTLTLTRLIVLKPLEPELTSVIIAVKMQGSKRVLRSTEIELLPGGTIETDLDLTFSLQYPHFLKREDNNLQILLQRRKKYKNRPMLGFKTLALGLVNMNQALQCRVEHELSLCIEGGAEVAATMTMLGVTSSPVDTKVDVANEDLTDEEEQSSSDASDSEPGVDALPGSRRGRKGRRKPGIRQQNLKQKLVGLLRKFKIPEEEEEEGEQEPNPRDLEDLIFDELEDLSDSAGEMEDSLSVHSTPKPSLRPYFDSARSSSTSREHLHKPVQIQVSDKYSDDSSKKDSGDSQTETLTDPELPGLGDEAGSGGTRKKSTWSPPLKPRFSLSRQDRPNITALKEGKSVALGGGAVGVVGEMSGERGGGVKRVERVAYTGFSEGVVSKEITEQSQQIFSHSQHISSHLYLINTSDADAERLSEVLKQELGADSDYLFCYHTVADCKHILRNLVQSLQHFCNTHSRAPPPTSIMLFGSGPDVNMLLRPYVELFSSKSPDWQNYVRFHLVPINTSCKLYKHLSLLDSTYQTLFQDKYWNETFSKPDSDHHTSQDFKEFWLRIQKYLLSATSVLQLPTSEIMLVPYKEREKNVDEELSQIFVPFLTDVRIGTAEGNTTQMPTADVDIPNVVVSDPLTAESTSSSSTTTSPATILPPPLSTTSHSPAHTVEQDAVTVGSGMSSSPPKHHGVAVAGERSGGKTDNISPPGSPNLNNSFNLSSSFSVSGEAVELQVEYWLAHSYLRQDSGRKDKEVNKGQMKTNFRYLHVHRLDQGTTPQDLLTSSSTTFTMTFLTKEKKQKIMRLGKKSKEMESRAQTVEGISRLVCTSKSQHHPLTVYIDGVEWNGVKFFQLSAQAQARVKHFPIALFQHLQSSV